MLPRQGSSIAKKSDKAHAGANAVTVGVRIRPPNSNEIKANMPVRFKSSV
jgi:hypothetical protein